MIKDFLEETNKEQELLDISHRQSKQNKADRTMKDKHMIRPYTPEEERILKEGLNENKEQSTHEVLMEGFKEEQLLRRLNDD
ncbi:hypothetical protein OAA03_00125 [bacterium]|nr:hypothetical protein [bacterium]